eukprot:1157638-Pelagomonas_calceolata.AAC.1
MDTRAAVVASGEGESHFNGSGKEHQGPQAAMKTEQLSSQEVGKHGRNKTREFAYLAHSCTGKQPFQLKFLAKHSWGTPPVGP